VGERKENRIRRGSGGGMEVYIMFMGVMGMFDV